MLALSHTFIVRIGATGDVPALVRLSTGPIAGKARFIKESMTSRAVLVAYREQDALGYAIWDRAFFGRAFIWLVGVDAPYRRRGVATLLLNRVLADCAAEPLFTSTNQSNAPMHRLLPRLGFVASGCVDNLDPGDPEMFYFKASDRDK